MKIDFQIPPSPLCKRGARGDFYGTVIVPDILLSHPDAAAVSVLPPVPTAWMLKELLVELAAVIFTVAGTWITAGFSLERLTATVWSTHRLVLEYLDPL